MLLAMRFPHRLVLSAALLGTAVVGAPAAAQAKTHAHHHAREKARASEQTRVFATVLLHEIDRARKEHGLHTVKADKRMSRGATEHSRNMARYHYFAHGAWSGRVARAANRPRGMGEVLGWLTPTNAAGEARWLVRSWLNSPEHRRVLLDGTFQRVGIGRVQGTIDGGHAAIYTVDFATKR